MTTARLTATPSSSTANNNSFAGQEKMTSKPHQHRCRLSGNNIVMPSAIAIAVMSGYGNTS